MSHVRGPLWLRRIASQLDNLAIVERVSISPSQLRIRFKTQLTKKFNIHTDITRLDDPVIILPLLCRSDALFDSKLNRRSVYIPYRQYSTSTLLQTELLTQQFISKLISLENPFLATSAELLTEQEIFRNYQLPELAPLSQITLNKPGGFVGRLFIEHYYDLTGLCGSLRVRPLATAHQGLIGTLRRAIRSLMKQHKTVTIRNVCRRMHCGPRLRSHELFTNLLRQVRATGPVLDWYPDTGEKALACAILGLEYQTLPGSRFDRAIRNGFIDCVGLKHSYYDGNTRAQIAFADAYFDKSRIMPIDFSVAKRTLYFVPIDSSLDDNCRSLFQIPIRAGTYLLGNFHITK